MVYWARLTDIKPDAAIRTAVQRATQLALQKWSPIQFEGPWTKGGLGIVDLRPRDVAVTNQAAGLQGAVAGSLGWGVTAVTASTWTNWINLPIDDRSFQIVTGVFNLTPDPKITGMKPLLNGQDLPVIGLEEIYAQDMQMAYLQQPYIVSPENRHTVQLNSPVTLAGVPSERIGLLGSVIAKREYLIST